MPMKLKRILLVLLSFSLLFSLCACKQDSSSEERETFPQETYIPMADGGLVLHDGLTIQEASADDNVLEWLNSCSATDRNDYFGGYVLRHDATDGENSVFTYLVYFPHGGEALTVTPELFMGISGYVLNLNYTPGDGVTGYSLCHLTVTVPMDMAPRIRVIVENQMPGVLISVSKKPIPVPGVNEKES